jgi:hypothetical protein
MITSVTFYNNKINKNIVDYQKKVFEFFKLPLNQIYCEKWIGHGQLVDNYIKSLGDNWEYFVLFDIDCVPLDNKIIEDGISWCQKNLGLFSVAQRHYRKSEVVYASPAFLIFSKKTYDLIGRPSFVETGRSDVAGELTHKCIEKNLPINMMYPKSVEEEKWILTKNQKFGRGTNYGDRIYHSFESRMDNVDLFVNKCKNVIGEK